MKKRNKNPSILKYGICCWQRDYSFQIMHLFSFFLIIHLCFLLYLLFLLLVFLLLAFLLAEVKERPSAFAFVKFTKC